MNRRMNSRILWVAMLFVFTLSACSGQPLTTREKGTIGGGVLGAGAGAIVGSAVGAPGAGAAIGGTMGAVAGGAIGNSLQNLEIGQHHMQTQLARQQKAIERQRMEIAKLKQRVESE